ncbi:MAG TPA: hypothetical protein VKF80_01345 [Candidatus Eisenbacteria bacterium]|nr:hypothetical protein [Candidatus Eisenbacteria bacterium]
MARRSRAVLALLVCLAAACQSAPRHEAAGARDTGPPHGGRAVDLGQGEHAELVVDETGMIVVRLYDPTWHLLDPAGKTVQVRIETPDGASIDIATEAMGTGSAAHFMAPMDKAVVEHVRESGSYTATVRAMVDGRQLEGSTLVKGLATGGQGM